MKKELEFISVSTPKIKAIVGKEEMQIASFRKDFYSKEYVLISLQDPDDKVILKSSHKKWKKFIHLKFFDVEEPTFDRGVWLQPINKEQVKQLLDFIMENKNERFFINCEAGVSRSAGVGLAVECILNFDGNLTNFNYQPHPILSHFRRYEPNYFVMNELVDLYNQTKTSFNEIVCPHCNCTIEEPVKSLKNGVSVDLCSFCYEDLKKV